MFFFPGHSGKRLLGFLHQPEKCLKSFALIYCHPFAEERNLSHSIAVKAARAMAKVGIPVLRFDLSGCGDSEGELTDSQLTDWVDDLACAAEVLKQKSGVTSIGLWGLRSGAFISLACASRFEAKLLLMWQPLVDLKIYMTQFLRQQAAAVIAGSQNAEVGSEPIKSIAKKIEEGETIEVMGYPISPKLYLSFNEFSAKPWKNPITIPLGIFCINTQAIIPTPIQKAVDELIRQGGKVDINVIEEVSFWDRFWCWESEALIRKSVQWLQSQDL